MKINNKDEIVRKVIKRMKTRGYINNDAKFIIAVAEMTMKILEEEK